MDEPRKWTPPLFLSRHAGFGEYAAGVGLGTVFGAVNPIGGIGGLAGSLLGGGIQALAGGSFFGRGLQFGGLAGGLIGGSLGSGLQAAGVKFGTSTLQAAIEVAGGTQTLMRQAALNGLPQLIAEGGGALAGAGLAYYGGVDPLLGANLGMMTAGISRAVVAPIVRRSLSPAAEGAMAGSIGGSRAWAAPYEPNGFERFAPPKAARWSKEELAAAPANARRPNVPFTYANDIPGFGEYSISQGIRIRPGLKPDVELGALRHEYGHMMLTKYSLGASILTYRLSNYAEIAEEFGVHLYATLSVSKALQHSLRYKNTGRLIGETVVIVGGIAYYVAHHKQGG